MNEAQKNPLAKDFRVFSLVRFAFPSMAMMVFMGLYTIVDTVFVARFVNTDALSAINIVCPVINLMVGLGTMLGAGGSAVVAKEMGSRKEEKARSDFTLIVVTGSLLGLAATAAGLFFLDEIIWGLGASAVLFPYCRDYLRTLLLFSAGNIMQVLAQNLIVTAGRPAFGLALSVLAGIANIVFDYVFIVLLHMGITGAALGTGIGYILPAAAGAVFFFSGKSQLHFSRFQVDFSVLRKSCFNGASEMVSQLSTAVTTFLFNGVMMRFLGEDGVAAITVLIYAGFLLTAVYIGFSMGVAPVISYNYGSGNGKRLKKIVSACFGVIGGISVFVFLISFLGGENIVGAFAGKNRNVLSIAKKGFSVYSYSFLFSGCNIFASALFTALSNGKASAVLSFLRTFGFILIFLFALPRFLGVTGVWLAVPIAELFTFVTAAHLLLRHRKK